MTLLDLAYTCYFLPLCAYVYVLMLYLALTMTERVKTSAPYAHLFGHYTINIVN